MRHAVIIRNPQGDKPEVQFFARLADAKPAFKALTLPDGDTAELWSSTSGRIKRRRGRAALSVSETAAPEVPKSQPPIEQVEAAQPVNDHMSVKRGRKAKE